MSYDIGLYYNNTEILELGNHTSNTFEMFRRALGNKGIIELWGKSPKESIRLLAKGIKYLEENKEELEKLNPSNGWGSYDSSLKYMILIKKKLFKFYKSKELKVKVY